MKTGNKIALFYSAITIGVIAVVTLVFYWVSTSYISRLYYSYLTEKAYATAQKHWEKDETDDESYARIQQRYEETLPVATEILLNADSLETRQVLSRYLDATQVRSLYQEDIVHFKHDTQMGAALYYPDNEGNFIVIVLSGNQYGMDIQHRIYVNTTLIHTAKGSTILLQYDVTTPRPYSRHQTVCGTKGFMQKYPVPCLLLDEYGKEPLSGEQFERMMEQYKHPFTAVIGEEARRKNMPNEMNYIMDYRLIHCLRNGLPLDQDVYDAAEWSCITELSERSVRQGSVPVEIPDFTRGNWKER